MILCSNLSVAV